MPATPRTTSLTSVTEFTPATVTVSPVASDAVYAALSSRLAPPLRDATTAAPRKSALSAATITLLAP